MELSKIIKIDKKVRISPKEAEAFNWKLNTQKGIKVKFKKEDKEQEIYKVFKLIERGDSLGISFGTTCNEYGLKPNDNIILETIEDKEEEPIEQKSKEIEEPTEDKPKPKEVEDIEEEPIEDEEIEPGVYKEEPEEELEEPEEEEEPKKEKTVLKELDGKLAFNEFEKEMKWRENNYGASSYDYHSYKKEGYEKQEKENYWKRHKKRLVDYTKVKGDLKSDGN